jgi:hypothetical protein
VTDSNLDAALAAWQTKVSGLTGIVSAPENATEAMGTSGYPFAVSYPRQGYYKGESSGFGYMIHTFVTEIHCSRNLLPKAIEQAKGFIEPLVRLTINDPKITASADTVIGERSPRYTFGELTWGRQGQEVIDIGLQFEIDVKILITGAG